MLKIARRNRAILRHPLLLGLIFCCILPRADALMLDRLRLPAGFSLSVFIDQVDNARQIVRGANGTVYVGTRRAGVVYAVTDTNEDGVGDQIYTIAHDLYMPSGVAYRDGTLYVAEVNRILAFDDIDSRPDAPPKPRVVFSGLPQESHHGWKFIEFGPDGKLYIPVGAPCNVCAVEDPYGTILRLDLSTGTTEVIARGVRNSVGFTLHPESGELWFTDNGRDMLGDDVPSCELNRVREFGQHFGFPFVHGKDTIDPDYGTRAKPANLTPPELELGAHVAPLSPLFYRGKLFPDEFRRSLLIAEHGSWNRSRKVGYRVMRAEFDSAGRITQYEPFITGWLVGQAHWGRPVDFEQMPDGSILLSDDHAGAIYRITYSADTTAVLDTR